MTPTLNDVLHFDIKLSPGALHHPLSESEGIYAEGRKELIHLFTYLLIHFKSY